MNEASLSRKQLYQRNYRSLSQGKLDREQGKIAEKLFETDKFYKKGWLNADRKIAMLVA